MCTTVILRRPGHDWPVILAANRDEMTDRPWLAPGRHWPDRPEVVAGLDREAGGTWLGLNDHGLLAGILNRMGSLGPQAGKRSRGELVLEALDHAEAAEAARALAHLEAAAYRSFNLLVADAERAFWLRNLGEEAPGRVEVFELPPGLSMLTARDLNDETSPRIGGYLPQFRATAAPNPEAGDWRSWQQILTSRQGTPADDPFAAMTIVSDQGFGTVSSSLIALPAAPRTLAAQPRPPVWLFAPGRPDRESYQPVDL
ncbi:MAG: NRDE family protein [Rhodospirillales bacterium]|nr:NRDE family protein [Rhodospirillales bacterium]MDH3910245.1 NRDE family protein [Rhodospirillales bacterium]MDH3919514.1 NRDE family protein [Rhodospirillales bacterium]MDH3967310.1 NRDE family protein [Rhodospirillales bacterium]